MPTFTFASDWFGNLAKDVDLETDTIAIALSNTAPASESSNPLTAGNGILANVTQISYTNYADDLATDREMENVTSAVSSGVLTLDFDDFELSASGGALAAFRYVYFVDTTVAASPVIGALDLGSEQNLTDGGLPMPVAIGAQGFMRFGAGTIA